MINMPAQISSSLPKGGPSLSPLTCWIFKHCMQSLYTRKFPTCTHLFIDFEAIFWWGGDGKALFQTDSQNPLNSHPSVTVFQCCHCIQRGMWALACQLFFQKERPSPLSFWKETGTSLQGDGFTCMKGGAHIISISCGEVFSQYCNFWENSWVSCNFPHPLQWEL